MTRGVKARRAMVRACGRAVFIIFCAVFPDADALAQERMVTPEVSQAMQGLWAGRATPKQVKQMQASYNRQINDYLKQEGVLDAPSDTWHNKLDTNFMADPAHDAVLPYANPGEKNIGPRPGRVRNELGKGGQMPAAAPGLAFFFRIAGNTLPPWDRVTLCSVSTGP